MIKPVFAHHEIKELQRLIFEEYGQKMELNEINQIGEKLVLLYHTALTNNKININKNENKWTSTDPQK